MTTYFLSYARADAAVALPFADGLIAAGVSLWVDQYDIRPSQHWDRAVETAVRSCEGMVVMLSPRSAASPNVADEVSVAIEAGKDVIPVLIESCTLPLRMTRMHFIDATTDPQGALKRCLHAMGRAHAAAPETRTFERPGPGLPSDVLRTAELRLIGVMGPISGVLVRAAAARAGSEVELYQALASSIPNEADRDAFLGWVTAPAPEQRAPTGPAGGSGAGLSTKELDAITLALARRLGPIARQLVQRESRSAPTRHDLCRRLAVRIEGDKDRAAFIRDVGA